MKPTIVLVGRPNVGKSTFFNRLTRSRDAIVADVPGLTRDRHYGEGRVGGRPYLIVDTGGLDPIAKDGMLLEMAKQTRLALAEADRVLFLVDGREGLTPQDQRIATMLRTLSKPIRLVVNKAEGMNRAIVTAEFYELGLGDPVAVSAAHGDGITVLMEDVLSDLPVDDDLPQDNRVPRIAVVGRPNVGKSTLVNALLGEERMIAFDRPGTTRDAIEVEFRHGGKRYLLVDTAGLRRKGRVFEGVEKFSVIKTLQAIDRANVAILVVDAQTEIADQDAHLAGFIVERGRALTVAVNKWDGLEGYARDQVKRALERKLGFLNFGRMHFVSARDHVGLQPLMASVDEAFAAAMVKLPTPRLTRLLQDAVIKQAPPRSGYTRPKMRYAHQGGSNPPVIIIHGTALQSVSDTYRRYLEGIFRRAFDLHGTPLRIEFRVGRNPFVHAD
ncbi:MAG: ribosome biogenesis GTPase Der [Betaproteobacteria bacterium]|nr:ribosome biogenesis GTPase Der [Betaproteobacteria bacterium]